jgi:hypothetical protein
LWYNKEKAEVGNLSLPLQREVYMKEINDRATTHIGYEGEVFIKHRRGNKEFVVKGHNNGLSPLFRCVAKAMAGYDTSGERMMWVDLRHAPQGSETFVTCLNNEVPITQLIFMQDGYGRWITRITAAISEDSLISPISADSTDVYRLYVMSNTRVDYAFFEVKDITALAAIQGTTQALIEWNLLFYNAETQQPSENANSSESGIRDTDMGADMI